MPRSARDQSATQTLLKHLENGATGRLSVGADANEVSVHVQQGAVLAADAPDDPRLYLRRLRAENAIDEKRSRELHALLDAGEPVFGQLLDEVAPDVLDRVLHDRFRDNLTRFVGSPEKPRFEFTAGVFVDNLQVGYDPKELLEDAWVCWDRAQRVSLDLAIGLGPERARTVKQAMIVAAAAQSHVVSHLLARLPLEPLAGRALIAEMLHADILRERKEQDDVPEDLPEADEETEMVEKEDATDPPSSDEDSEVIERPRRASIEEDVGDAPTTLDRAPPTIEGAGNLESLDAWMGHGVTVEDDLDAFADYDEVRGQGAKGFSMERHNLDRVEVAEELTGKVPEPEPDLPPDEQAIEADELPQARFGAPTLTDDEAMEKLAVANDVMVSIVATFDDEQGAGAGRAALQLLLDGSPAKYAALFADVQATEDGGIPLRQVLRNLHTRPPSEYRAIVNEGLVDLIERSLSLAADELSDTAIDNLLEQVAGYRQRMGL